MRRLAAHERHGCLHGATLPKADLLKDQTGKQFAEYQARIYSWDTKGGFTDELGKRHEPGHHYKIDYWGVLNATAPELRLAPFATAVVNGN